MLSVAGRMGAGIAGYQLSAGDRERVRPSSAPGLLGTGSGGCLAYAHHRSSALTSLATHAVLHLLQSFLLHGVDFSSLYARRGSTKNKELTKIQTSACQEVAIAARSRDRRIRADAASAWKQTAPRVKSEPGSAVQVLLLSILPKAICPSLPCTLFQCRAVFTKGTCLSTLGSIPLCRTHRSTPNEP